MSLLALLFCSFADLLFIPNGFFETPMRQSKLLHYTKSAHLFLHFSPSNIFRDLMSSSNKYNDYI